ncbi:hypothetical protein EON67_02910, partial [archaeon]
MAVERALIVAADARQGVQTILRAATHALRRGVRKAALHTDAMAAWARAVGGLSQGCKRASGRRRARVVAGRSVPPLLGMTMSGGTVLTPYARARERFPTAHIPH